MSVRPFSLIPFPGGPAAAFGIDGRVSREGSRLTLVYGLTGAVAGVAWPPAATPTRQDRLWEATCAECFVARPEDGGYWEANFAPTGHWQLYRFAGYRAGMRLEPTIATPAIVTEQDAAAYRLSATLDLDALIQPEEPLQVGITMVVRTTAGAMSYWALAHPGAQPDFHQRAGFALAL